MEEPREAERAAEKVPSEVQAIIMGSRPLDDSAAAVDWHMTGFEAHATPTLTPFTHG